MGGEEGKKAMAKHNDKLPFVIVSRVLSPESERKTEVVLLVGAEETSKFIIPRQKRKPPN